MKLFLSPHHDDETLFAAFTLMREQPLVVFAFDGYVQANRGVNVTAQQRRAESIHAGNELGLLERGYHLGLRDDDASVKVDDIVFRLRSVVDVDQRFEAIYMPMYDADGHDQHNLVALAGNMLEADRYVRYSTYTRNGGRQRTANEVAPLDGDMIARKHRALACYTSQLDLDPRLGCYPHFMCDLLEYVQ